MEIFKHIPYWILILVLLVILGVKWTAPSVAKAVQSVQQVAVPSRQVEQYPLVGCAISRVNFGAWWE